MTWDEVRLAYRDAARGLLDGGVDFLLVETIFDTLNSKAAIYAILELLAERGEDVPLWISGTITDRSGRTLSGQTTEAFYRSIAHCNPLGVGLNCALGGRELAPYVQDLSRVADRWVSAYPNAGLPNELGGYDEAAAETAAVVRELAACGLLQRRGGLLRDGSRPHRGDRRGGGGARAPQGPRDRRPPCD